MAVCRVFGGVGNLSGSTGNVWVALAVLVGELLYEC